MGQQVSKSELVFQHASGGNVEAIKALHREGASLEWIDADGKTPLILACMNPHHYDVAKTLIELGANVNAYRPGRHAGCPLHHSAKRGLDQTVKLLLTHGANALRMNDAGQTPLDVARVKRYSNVVRTIESHISLFSGWLRQLYGVGFLQALAPQLFSRKIWVVVLPSVKRGKSLKYVVALYSSQQDARPFATIPLWKAQIEEPMFHQPDPAIIIFCKATRTQVKLAPADEGDKQQLQCFYNACRGICQARQSSLSHDTHAPVVPGPAPAPATAPATAPAPSLTNEDIELAMAISASIQSATQEGVPIFSDDHLTSEVSNTNGWGSANYHNGNGWIQPVPPRGASSSHWIDQPAIHKYNGWGTMSTKPSGNQSQQLVYTSNGFEGSIQIDQNVSDTAGTSEPPPSAADIGSLNKPDKNFHHGCSASEAGPSRSIPPHDLTDVPVADTILEPASVPLAPLVLESADDEQLVQYPSVDTSPVDLTISSVENIPEKTKVKKDTDDSSSCAICLDAPIEGACIPCGHMAGCMSCLNEIKTKKWGCPVCRANIDQVLRLYSV
ncbi:hypothetical protein Syun_030027 [Stephania yunnanensis]|uniref:RING-type domain-containing protein n=1 Tax=Stephania yunnanensis TaxID=152371 RepID=A0AAP0E9P7_9MAGN